MTASSPLNARATDDQNGTDSAASGIGFSQSAWDELHPGPLYAPSLQCRSSITMMPLAFSNWT